MSNIAELHQAFTWICDHCGRRNYVRTIRDETAEGLQEDEIQVMIPEIVQCKKCDEKYTSRIVA